MGAATLKLEQESNAAADFGDASPPAWDDARTGQVLVERRLLTTKQLAEAMKKAEAGGSTLEEVLVEPGLVGQRDYTAAVAAALDIPFTVLFPSMVHSEAVRCLPAAFCEKHNVLPFAAADGWVTVAVENFDDVHLLEQIRRLTQQRVQIVAAEAQNIRSARHRIREAPTEDAGVPSESVLDEAAASFDSAELQDLRVLTVQNEPEDQEARDLEAAAAGSPVIRLVNHIIKAAVAARASDIHIEPDEKEVCIRYRIDGELTRERLNPAVTLLPAIVSRIKIMAGMDIAERRLPQDGAMAVMLLDRPIELRVSTMATPAGEKVVMRIVDNNSGARKLEQLGLSPAVLGGFRSTITQPNGIVLVTGPTGSGKSTTLYAALAEMADEKLNISSIEDPVELRLRGISQFQVNNKAGFTFPRALRSLLRQDPDVIMVGEIRDAETAKLATEAALTGHLVLSTLHTNDSIGAVPRLVNMGVEPYLVSASMRAVLAQRLVKRLCPHCRHEVALSPGVKQSLATAYGGKCPIETAFAGEGCGRCRQTGFAGRTGIHELLLTDEEMLSALGHDLSVGNVREVAQKHGMITMLDDALDKVRAGTVAVEALFEVLGRADSPPEAAAA